MKSRLLKFLPTLASILVGILPVVILIQYFAVSRKLIVGWGFLSYIIGVTVIKMPLYHFFVVKVLHGKLSNVWLSISQGIVSAISELGAALVFFLFVVPSLNLAQLIGFGAAAGAVEAIMLPFINNPLKGTPLEEHSSDTLKKSASSLSIAWMAVLERVLAFPPHIATRGMLYVSFITGNVFPALLAVLTFASMDGRAYFAHLEKWEFDRPSVLARLYLYLAVVGLVQILLFVGFYRQMM